MATLQTDRSRRCCRSLQTIIPDTLQLQTQHPEPERRRLHAEGAPGVEGQDFFVPPIPGVIVIPGDIGFLNQFFSVMLMVGNVAPGGSNLVVSDLTAEIVLPPGKDNVVGSADDPLAMARTRRRRDAAHRGGRRSPGPTASSGPADDIDDARAGRDRQRRVPRRRPARRQPRRRDGDDRHAATGCRSARCRFAAAPPASVLVRNPTFTLTFTHPEVVNAGEPYTLDVTVTNTSESPANFVSVNLFRATSAARGWTASRARTIEAIAPGDSATVTFDLISNRTGKVTAATLDSDEHVAGRFALKTAVGELGVPLSPDSLVLPKEAGSLPARAARCGARPARQGVGGRDRAGGGAAEGPVPLLEEDRARPRGRGGRGRLPRARWASRCRASASTLLMDFMGSEFTTLASRVPANDTTGLLGMLQRDVQGFDLVRRRSVRGDVFADAVARDPRRR